MAFQEAEVTITRSVALQAICEHCGHKYQFNRNVSATAKSGWGKNSSKLRSQASDKARDKLKGRRPSVSDRVDGVVCPRCKRFSAAATRAHFPEGIHQGLQKILRSSAVTHAVWSGVGLAIFPMLVWFQYTHWEEVQRNIRENEGLGVPFAYFTLGMVWLIAFVFLGVFPVLGLWHARAASRNLRRLSAIDDKRLHVIAADACLANDNSMSQDVSSVFEDPSLVGAKYAYCLVSRLNDFFKSPEGSALPIPDKTGAQSGKSGSSVTYMNQIISDTVDELVVVKCCECGWRCRVRASKAHKRVRCRDCERRRAKTQRAKRR